MVEEGKLSAGHARSLVVVTNPEAQLKLANLAVTKKITVRDMEKAVKEAQQGTKIKRDKKQ
jgi:ParB-like chromosome segregation protein Spo0J